VKVILYIAMLFAVLFGSDFNIELTNKTLMLNTTIKFPFHDNKAGIRGDYLYNDDEKKSDYYISLGGEIEGTIKQQNNMKFSVFIDYSAIKDNSALPIGVGFLWNMNKKFVNVETAYAPQVLSFEDATRFLKAKIEIGIVPIDKVYILFGYRHISFNKVYQSIGYLGAGIVF
jgi:hypothetical protein